MINVPEERLGRFLSAITERGIQRFEAARVMTTRISGNVCVRLQPHRTGSATLLVTDTGVSWYLEVPEAKWEFDSSDAMGSDELAQFEWAVDICVSIARFGMIRTRPKWLPFGRESFVLTEVSGMESHRNDGKREVTHYWPPW
ncbi:hypothetical protein [Luethyella okanaganae]|uniref:Uncharacterized protein n=1 Tax=Luethyella okanaganae TaxID=69372 RepID=A0ABW1VEL6_9MICO